MQSSKKERFNTRMSKVLLPEVVYFQEGPGIRKKEHAPTGIPFVNIRCIQHGRLKKQRMNYVSEHTASQRYAHFMLEKDDILLSGSGTLGKVAQIKTTHLPCLLNTGLMRLRTTNPDILDQQYLLYYLQSSLFQQEIACQAIGSVQKNFGPSHLAQMQISVPPLPQQQETAQLLGNIDAMIDSIYDSNIMLHKINHLLFQHTFTDYLHNKKHTLAELCQLMLGGDWGEDNPSQGLVAVRCLRGVDITTLHRDGYADIPLRWITRQSLKKRQLGKNDIVIAASGAGNCGQAIWCCEKLLQLYPEPVIHSNFCKRLQADTEANAMFVAQLLHELYEDKKIQLFVHGTSVPNLDIHGLMHSKIVPEHSAQQRRDYAAQAKPYYELLYSRQIYFLQQLKQQLLQELFAA